jgi:hypothetical protein
MSIDKDKKASIERIKNQLEQAKLNLRLASEHDDKCEIRAWSKQVRLIQAVLQRVQEISSKKS